MGQGDLQKIFDAIMANNFLNLMKKFEKVQHNKNKINVNKTTLVHIMSKLYKTNDKEKNFKSSKIKRHITSTYYTHSKNK